MHDLAVQKILSCLDDILFEPDKRWSNDDFERQSYARWAAYEIINLIMDKPYDMPEIAAEEFMYTMATFAAFTKNSKKRRIFEIACDTANDILTIL